MRQSDIITAEFLKTFSILISVTYSPRYDTKLYLQSLFAHGILFFRKYPIEFMSLNVHIFEFYFN